MQAEFRARAVERRAEGELVGERKGDMSIMGRVCVGGSGCCSLC